MSPCCINKPELVTLIQQHMESRGFQSIEDVLMDALTVAAAIELSNELTGADLVAAMQACPLKDVDIEPAPNEL